MSVAKCAHPYYRLEDGELICVSCGETSGKMKVEDKEQKVETTKRIWPSKSKRRK